MRAFAVAIVTLLFFSGGASAWDGATHSGDSFSAGIPDGPRPLASEPHGTPSFLPDRAWTPMSTPDPGIAQLTGLINGADLLAEIEWLVGLGNRYTLAKGINTVGSTLETRLASYGLATEKHPFIYNALPRYNIVATQTGTVYPDSFFVVCAHYDAISEDPWVYTPGADDNGSGVAAVLTCARLLAPCSTDYSIKYVLFAAEEQGMQGSAPWLSDMAAQSLPIVGGLNCDMFGWWQPGVNFDLEIETNAHSRWIAHAMVNAAALYPCMPVHLHQGEYYNWGDFYRFWENGYACVNHEEAFDWFDPDFNPYYHSTDDLPENLSLEMLEGSTRVVFSGLATLAGINVLVTPVTEPVAVSWFAGAYPNPFNAHTTVTVHAPVEDSLYEMKFFDSAGRFVGASPLVMRGGVGGVGWGARDRTGASLASGAYFYRVELGDRDVGGKVFLVK